VVSFFGSGESAFARPDQRHIVYLPPGRDSLFLFEQLDQLFDELYQLIRRQQSDLIDNDFKLASGHINLLVCRTADFRLLRAGLKN